MGNASWGGNDPYRPRMKRVRYSAIAGVLFTAFIFVFSGAFVPRSKQTMYFPIGSFRPTSSHLWNTSPSPTRSQRHAAESSLHLLVPANQTEVNVCKLLLSSTILRYPTAMLLNWARTYKDESLVSGGSHILKLYGVAEYLGALGVDADEDLVIIVDGYDSWFQLDPKVLLKRYAGVIAESNARLVTEVGSEAMTSYGIRSSIVFSSQKSCWPGDETESWCWAVPTSQLPHDIYGTGTDLPYGEPESSTYATKFRQRFLNSGFMVGPVKDLKALFNRAIRVWEKDPVWGSDQAIFTQIFGTQEYHRTFLKELRNQGLQSFPNYASSPLSIRPTDEKMVNERIRSAHPDAHIPELDFGGHFEFGIVLDYESVLSQPTVFADTDLEWISHNDEESLSQVYADHNVTSSHAAQLDKDILSVSIAQNPFTELPSHTMPSGLKSTSSSNGIFIPNASTTWNDVELYTNLWTGVTPAVIHHNAHRDGLKANRETMWPKIWFQPFARYLLASRIAEERWKWPANIPRPLPKIAIYESDNQSDSSGGWASKGHPKHERQFRYLQKHNLGFRTDERDESGQYMWISWEALCDADMDKEIFRDKIIE